MLKDMGFDGTCEYCFDTRNSNPVDRQTPTNVFGDGAHNSSDPYLISCPHIVDASEWVRSHYGININVHRIPGLQLFTFKCYELPFHTDGVVYTNENSCWNKAIQYTLKILAHDRK